MEKDFKVLVADYLKEKGISVGDISFFGGNDQVDAAMRIYNSKLEAARAEGKWEVIHNIVNAVEKFVSSV